VKCSRAFGVGLLDTTERASEWIILTRGRTGRPLAAKVPEWQTLQRSAGSNSSTTLRGWACVGRRLSTSERKFRCAKLPLTHLGARARATGSSRLGARLPASGHCRLAAVTVTVAVPPLLG
jgi:hypothetical protein